MRFFVQVRTGKNAWVPIVRDFDREGAGEFARRVSSHLGVVTRVVDTLGVTYVIWTFIGAGLFGDLLRESQAENAVVHSHSVEGTGDCEFGHRRDAHSTVQFRPTNGVPLFGRASRFVAQA